MHRLANPPITTWKQFAQTVRSSNCKLLKRLDEFPNSILVTGCQRSGTTVLARILTESAGMTNYGDGKYDELAAALILSGYMNHIPRGRYCFQTTYLNECYHEYYDHSEAFKMVWLTRNPYSVVYSMVYNWPSRVLKRNFMGCAAYQISGFDKIMYELWGSRWISPVRQAILLYKAKTLQLLDLIERLGRKKIMVVDYDDLVLDREIILRKIYKFVELDYYVEYSEKIHRKSIDKKNRLSDSETRIVERLALPVYEKAQLLRGI